MEVSIWSFVQRLDILRYANLFVGEEKYKEVQERYEI